MSNLGPKILSKAPQSESFRLTEPERVAKRWETAATTKAQKAKETNLGIVGRKVGGLRILYLDPFTEK